MISVPLHDFEARLPPWLVLAASGLYCRPADVYIDPHAAVDRAIISHGHADHARPGHGAVLATEETVAIMKARYPAPPSPRYQVAAYGETVHLGGAAVRLLPAGHILGSAQVSIAYAGTRVVVSGDFKRQDDPTCLPFEPEACDVFITEATFGLPVFCHPETAIEIDRLLASLRLFPDRCHLVGVYALGKCQRVVSSLRARGFDKPVYLHGALVNLCRLYEATGVELGPWRPVSEADRGTLRGEIVLCPPSALADRWSRAFPDVLPAMASGWMRVRQRARQRGIELPLVISDHADWPGLTHTLDEVGAATVFVTHGREEALIHHARGRGMRAAALPIPARDGDDA